MKLRRLKLVQALYAFVIVVVVAAICYMANVVILRQTSNPDFMPLFKMSNQPEIVLALQIFGLTGLLLPVPILRKLRIRVPAIIPALWSIFIFSTIFLGEVCGFYHISHYDKILHIFAGFTIAVLGFLVVDLLDKPKSAGSMSRLFVAVFAFCFSLALNVSWEIFEFIMDSCFVDSNMQRYMVAPGYPFIGRDALMDTMMDINVAAIGAILAVVAISIYAKRHRDWLERSQLKRIQDK